MWKIALLIVSSLLFAHGHVVKRQVQRCPDECENKALDISLIVDASSSISQDNFTRGLLFLRDFVNQFDIGRDKVRISMVTYGDRVFTEDAFGFQQYGDKDQLQVAIDSMPYRGGNLTETGMAIKWFLENQQPEVREGVRSVVIVLTDGNSQRPSVTKAEAKKALEKGLEVFAIGVGHSVSQEELHSIASDRDHVFTVYEYGALDDIKSWLTYEACRDISHPTCSYSPLDVVFVIDSSRSVGDANFILELDFITDFLKEFQINPSFTRVAAVMFGDRVYEETAINFDKYTDTKDTLEAILKLKYMNGGSTETGAGIQFMIDNFVPKFRQHAAHIGIIITDGESQKWEFTKKAAADARAHGITIIAVGVSELGKTGKLHYRELENIAGDPARVVTVDNFDKLIAIRDTLLRITCAGAISEIRNKGTQ